MRWTHSLASAYLIISLACGSSGSNHIGQQAADQPMKFKLLKLTTGVTPSGASFGGKVYKTDSGAELYFTNVHLRSRESTKEEYDDWLNRAVKVLSRGKVEGVGGKEPPTTEYRAVAIFAARTSQPKEFTTILTTAGTDLHVIQSSSSEAAFEFETQFFNTPYK